MSFDSFVMVDWSGGNDRGPGPKPDAIWIGAVLWGRAADPVYCRNRQVAEARLTAVIEAEARAGRRLLIGFDFPFGYPAGFSKALTGRADPFAIWDWFTPRVEDRPDRNNRFDLAAGINRRFGGQGPFWGNGLKRDIDGLPRRKDGYRNPFADRRASDAAAKGAFSCWQLAGAGAVGSQVIMGLPVLARLRQAHGARIWPFEVPDGPLVFVEIWPSLIAGTIAAYRQPGEIRDRAQVRVMAHALANLPAPVLRDAPDVAAREEGWIFGLGFEDALAVSAARC